MRCYEKKKGELVPRFKKEMVLFCTQNNYISKDKQLSVLTIRQIAVCHCTQGEKTLNECVCIHIYTHIVHELNISFLKYPDWGVNPHVLSIYSM